MAEPISAEENPIRVCALLSSLKLRGSWGMIGDQTVSSSLYVPTISQGQASWLDPSGNKIIYAGTPAAVDPRITWQDIATLDFGFDARFFNGELGVTFDWYQRDTKNMIVPGEGVTWTFGAGSPKGNFGSLRTRGFTIPTKYLPYADLGRNKKNYLRKTF